MARLKDAFADRVQRSPDDLAVRLPSGEVWTWAGLGSRVDAMSAELTAAGVADGGRIVSLSEVGPGSPVLFYAALQVGASLVPLNTRLTPGEVAEHIAAVMPDLVIADPDLAHLLPAHTAAMRWVGDHRAGSPQAWLPERQASLTASVVVFTSGTTGIAKPVVLTSENLESSARGSTAILGLRAADCWLVCVPLYHVAGIGILIRAVLTGCSIELHGRFEPALVNAAVGAGRVTFASVVPTMLHRMLDDPSAKELPGALRCVMLGGGLIPPDLVLRARTAGVPVAPTYGLTEAGSTVTVLDPSEATKRPASAGKPIPGIDLRIAHDGTTVLARELGEIEVRGAPVARVGIDGAGTRARDDWFNTGDVGCLGPHGYVFVVDRRTDLIVSGGENVMPAEVERVLESHPGVAEAAVYGRSDFEWGQIVCAAVVRRQVVGVTAEELVEHCRASLAAYKAPRQVRFVDALPRTASGKVKRHELREGRGGG